MHTSVGARDVGWVHGTAVAPWPARVMLLKVGEQLQTRCRATRFNKGSAPCKSEGCCSGDGITRAPLCTQNMDALDRHLQPASGADPGQRERVTRGPTTSPSPGRVVRTNLRTVLSAGAFGRARFGLKRRQQQQEQQHKRQRELAGP